MQKEALDILEGAEGSWWDMGRQAAIGAVLRGTYNRVLDYGAGFGSEFSFLNRYGQKVFAYEPAQALHPALMKRGYEKIYSSSEEALTHSYNLVALLDVLEHIEDDAGAVKKIFDALAPEGVMVVTVPAYQWLWSKHDENNLHFRRYTTRTLRRVLHGAGFNIEYLGYWNMMLLLPLGAVRFLGGTGESGLKPSRFVDRLLLAWLKVEAFVMRWVPLPFGVSVIARVKKVG